MTNTFTLQKYVLFAANFFLILNICLYCKLLFLQSFICFLNEVNINWIDWLNGHRLKLPWERREKRDMLVAGWVFVFDRELNRRSLRMPCQMIGSDAVFKMYKNWWFVYLVIPLQQYLRSWACINSINWILTIWITHARRFHRFRIYQVGHFMPRSKRDSLRYDLIGYGRAVKTVFGSL